MAVSGAAAAAAVAAFAATNIDDFVVLVVFFAKAHSTVRELASSDAPTPNAAGMAPRSVVDAEQHEDAETAASASSSSATESVTTASSSPSSVSTLRPIFQVVLGQLLGFSVICALSCIGIGLALAVPSRIVALLGFVPLCMGLYGVWGWIRAWYKSRRAGQHVSTSAPSSSPPESADQPAQQTSSDGVGAEGISLKDHEEAPTSSSSTVLPDSASPDGSSAQTTTQPAELEAAGDAMRMGAPQHGEGTDCQANGEVAQSSEAALVATGMPKDANVTAPSATVVSNVNAADDDDDDDDPQQNWLVRALSLTCGCLHACLLACLGERCLRMLTRLAPSRMTVTVAITSLANGSDNVSIYIPLFAAITPLGVAVTLAIFYAMLFVWCGVALGLVACPLVAKLISRVGDKLAPLLFIGIGCYILSDSLIFPQR